MENDTPSSKNQPRTKKRVDALAALPSLLTLGNAVSGFAAIIALLKAYTFLQEGDAFEAGNSMYYATGFLALGMFCDMLDGRVARMTGTDSQMGAQLDSLCDAVTFCLAPAVFMRVFGEALAGPGLHEDTSIAIRAIWVAAALYLACGLLRLARFNVETAEDDDHSEFSGLPTPAACGAVVSLFFVARFTGDPENGVFGAASFFTWALPILGGGFALLMISRVRYGHAINRFTKGNRTIPQLVILMGIIGASFIIFGPRFELVFALLMLFYIAYGLSLWAIDLAKAKSANATLHALPVKEDAPQQGAEG